MHYEFFPPEVIELQKEALLHPVLVEQLNARSDTSTVGGLVVVASYCDVLVDGRYTQPELYKLARTLLDRLKAKRGEIIITGEHK